MERRQLLANGAAVAGMLGISGCASLSANDRERSPAESTEQTSTGTVLTYPAYPILEFTELTANPEGPDTENLADEVVRLEFTKNVESFSLAGFHLTYEPANHTYEFTDFVSGDVLGGTTVEIHTGRGEPGIDTSQPPEYRLFVGSPDPLLRNSGGTVALTSPDGDLISEVTYPALSEGETFTVSG